MITESIQFKPTKSGLPSLSEYGGGSSNNGFARIISSINGKRKKPIYVVSKGDLVNNDHAWFVIKQDEIIVTASHLEENFNIKVFKVKDIDSNNSNIILELIENYKDNKQDDYFNSKYFEVIKAAVDKSKIYHCRRALYYYDPNYSKASNR